MHGRRMKMKQIHQHLAEGHDHPGVDHWGRGRGRGPGQHGRGGRRRRSRVSRGEVRNAVLRLLAEEPMHGYQIMQEMQERSDGGWEPSPGSIYPTLQQLADEDLVVGESREGKNVFSLTDEGRAVVAASEEPPAWERFQGDGSHPAHLKRAMMQLGAAARQVAMAGTEAQIEQAAAVLADARKRLYQILAADDED